MALLGVGTGVLLSCFGLGCRSSVGGKTGVPEMERRFVVVDAAVVCGGSGGGARGARGDGEGILLAR